MSLRRKTRASLSGPGSSNTNTPSTSFRKRSKSSGPTKRWAKVFRYPAPTVPFKVLKWVPVDELSDEEKKEWHDEQQKIKGSVLFGNMEEEDMEVSENDKNVDADADLMDKEIRNEDDADAKETEHIDVPPTTRDQLDCII
jgi:hypothetical protein